MSFVRCWRSPVSLSLIVRRIPGAFALSNSKTDEVAVISRSNWCVIVAVLFIVSLLIGLVAVSSIKGPVSDIRIRNSTNFDLQDVTVGRGHYGSIGRGEVSEYQTWGPAYQYARVSLVADGKPMLLQPIDYAGETMLGPGRFTYVLSFRRASERNALDIAFVRD
jgi:hypothetical protein